ncbi:hypothetical protein WKH79_07135 [Qipengyuania sp. GPGPB31]|uniref:hypothetical protein n=1 Tax=Qipengyuania sp. GPGPB31 TaxID=3023518 RepID=UPI00313458FC
MARLFGPIAGRPGNFGSEVYPCYAGLVGADSEARSMVWLLSHPETTKTGEPLSSKLTRAEKLESLMWRYNVAERRCLITETQFAETEDEKRRGL